ncbi:MAG: DUF4058 family protein [Planctomycetes bacterium]|nr:DUF4058 family protein [Planctomycetota bacterium]
MPSPFPGMDPFIESADWEHFHLRYIVGLSDALLPRVRPRYVVRPERRIYLEHRLRDEEEALILPDLAVLRPSAAAFAPSVPATQSQSTGSRPILLHLPMPEEHRETYLTIRLRESLEVVAILEILSPTNKRRRSDGRRKYLAKREAVLQSATHLVELDLLRGGERLPTREPLPESDYFAFVSRGTRRPQTEAYAWSLRDRLPTIPIPLAAGDPDVLLDLQAVFDAVYDHAGYDYSLDYAGLVRPPLSEGDAVWVRGLLPR